MIVEAIIIGFSIVFGFWLLSKTLTHIGEVFLRYMSARDREAKRKSEK